MSTQHERVAELERRLNDGFTKIGEAMAHGIAVDDWENFWVQLLREYEHLSDEIARVNEGFTGK